VGLTHLDEHGRVVMVDVGDKDVTRRQARACGSISMTPETYAAIIEERIRKGNVLATAKIAAIMAAKNTANIIPLCHPLPIDQITVEFYPHEETHTIEVQAEVKVTARTGVEMEALHAASIALLTIYDMCKAMDRTMVMGGISLMEKSGGRSGHYVRTGEE
jgi:cyclic pyranopterin monophosphate synthase